MACYVKKNKKYGDWLKKENKEFLGQLGSQAIIEGFEFD